MSCLDTILVCPNVCEKGLFLKYNYLSVVGLILEHICITYFNRLWAQDFSCATYSIICVKETKCLYFTESKSQIEI